MQVSSGRFYGLGREIKARGINLGIIEIQVTTEAKGEAEKTRGERGG